MWTFDKIQFTLAFALHATRCLMTVITVCIYAINREDGYVCFCTQMAIFLSGADGRVDDIAAATVASTVSAGAAAAAAAAAACEQVVHASSCVGPLTTQYTVGAIYCGPVRTLDIEYGHHSVFFTPDLKDPAHCEAAARPGRRSSRGGCDVVGISNNRLAAARKTRTHT
jgi:hypothetical protein